MLQNIYRRMYLGWFKKGLVFLFILEVGIIYYNFFFIFNKLNKKIPSYVQGRPYRFLNRGSFIINSPSFFYQFLILSNNIKGLFYLFYMKNGIYKLLLFYRKLHLLHYQLLNMSHQALCQDIFLDKSCEGGIPETGKTTGYIY